MGTFSATLRAIGDVQPLPATIELEDGRLSIAAGETEIGNWALSDLHFEATPNGYRMAAEGEQILIELKDLDTFAAALSNGKKRRIGLPLARKTKTTPALEPEPAAAATPVPAPTPVAAVTPVPASTPMPAVTPVASTDHSTPARVVAMPPDPGLAVASPSKEKAKAKTKEAKTKEAKQSAGLSDKGLNFVDATLAKASKRLGPYLPPWMFTRFMFGVVVISLILMIVLPGLVSTLLLIAGALIVTFGAVVYSDPMLASRWLPGRSTPPHVLIFGVAILLLGVLLGVISRA